MSKPQAVALQVSPVQRALLQRLVRRQTADQRLVRRASLVLALAADPCVQAVARQQGLTRKSVRRWRDCWRQATQCQERLRSCRLGFLLRNPGFLRVGQREELRRFGGGIKGRPPYSPTGAATG